MNILDADVTDPAEYLPGNRLDLLESGTGYFPALLAAIDAATQEVHLETYIFENDETGRAIAAALSCAARRGVAVRLLVDGFGSHDFSSALGHSLTAAGVEWLIYRPEAGRFLFRRHRLRRLHRKLAVIDARIAFVGGINIVNDRHDPHQIAPRFDYAVRIEGPLVTRVHHTLRHVWRLVRWVKLRRRPPAPEPLKDISLSVGSISAALLVRDNLRHRHDIEHAYISAIEAARHDVIIANAYFLPGRRFRQVLIDAANRGVAVTLLLQGRVEYALLHYATLSLYGFLLTAGVRIVEYRASFLHAKVAVVDGEWATIGSSNIDPFSLLLAREANIVVRDSGFSRQLHASLEQAMLEGGQEVMADELGRRPWWQRTVNRLAYSSIRLLVGMTGYVRRRR